MGLGSVLGEVEGPLGCTKMAAGTHQVPQADTKERHESNCGPRGGKLDVPNDPAEG